MGDGDLNIHVKTASDGKGLQDAKKQIAEVTQAAEKLGGKGGGILGAVSSGFNAISATLGGLAVGVGAFKKAISEYSEAQRVVNELDSALRQHGQLLDSVRTRYQEMAGELQDTFAIADDEWLKVITRFTQFGVGADRMEDVIKTTVNLAGVTGDLRSATELTVRALQGNFEALRRYGIVLPETSDKLERWNTLQQKAAEIGGGQLAAAASGLDGDFRRLKHSVSDSFEALGRLIVVTRVLEMPLKSVTEILQTLSTLFGGIIPKAAGVENIFGRTKVTLEQSAAAADRYAAGLKSINDESERRAKRQSAELGALEAQKRAEEELAEAALRRDIEQVRAWEREKRISPERAEALIGSLTTGAEAGRFQRAQRFREAAARRLENLIANEDARVGAAEGEERKAQAALQDDANIQAEFARQTGPVNARIAELIKVREQELKNAGGVTWARGVRDTDALIAAERAKLQGIADRFNSANPPVNPALEQNAEAARKNLEAVRRSAFERKAGFQEQLGHRRLEFDTAAAVRGTATQGSWAAQSNAGAQIFSNAMNAEIAAFQSYHSSNASALKSHAQAIKQLAAELQQLRIDQRVVSDRQRHMRNP